MPGPTIAVDAMGGDHAPAEIIAGAVAAARDLGLSVLLVGPIDQVSEQVARCAGGAAPASLSLLDAPEFITMDDAPLSALRRKPGASVRVAAEAVSSGDADAFYTVGHSGAALMAAHAAFGLLGGAERPALAVLVPTLAGSAVLLDTGATLECRPHHLSAFGIMGAAYASIVLDLARPRVGLLTVGEEAGEGTELVREAHALLSASPVNFVGNVEARDVFNGQVDVIVCDGFTGNITLKVCEGLAETMERLLKREVGPSLAARLGAWLTKDAFTRLRNRVSAVEHGGAPLLGVNGLALVGHGRSRASAVRNGIATAARLADLQLVSRMRAALKMTSEAAAPSEQPEGH